jgi:DNA helicase-2/ATP-dependent DNA helicase PcrA
MLNLVMSTYRDRLSWKFKEEYGKLNKGTATGCGFHRRTGDGYCRTRYWQTQILAARIGKILLDTDADPSNILCLTYTDAGVIAMRRRLQEFIGPVPIRLIFTPSMHSVTSVIQENLSLFERNSLDSVSELERIELLKIDRCLS